MPILCLMNWLDPRGFVFQFSLKAPHLQTHSKGKFKIWFLHCNPFSFSDRIDTLDIKKFNCHPILPFQSLLLFQIHDLALCGEQNSCFNEGLKIYEICFEMETPPFQNFPKNVWVKADQKCFTEFALFKKILLLTLQNYIHQQYQAR